MVKEVSISAEEMSQQGVQFGHRVSRLHPRMKPFVAGIKNNVHIIDLEKTAKELDKVLKFVAKLASENKTILFVGTKIQLRGLVSEAAKACGMPYVTERWLGGTFTNFETISKRVAYFKDLEKKKAIGELEKYTKKERMNMDKEIALLKTKFDGIRDMARLPDAVFIAGVDKDITCAREAKIKNIKIIGIIDTNLNPDIVDYSIPANDDAISAVGYIIDKVRDTIINSKNTNK